MGIDIFKAKRKSLRTAFTVCCNGISNRIETETLGNNEINALYKQLQDKFSRLETTQEEISDLLLINKELKNTYQDNFSKAEEYRDKFCQICSLLEASQEKTVLAPEENISEKPRSVEDSSPQDSARSLNKLLCFLRNEVLSEEMIKLARTGLGASCVSHPLSEPDEPDCSTAAALVNFQDNSDPNGKGLKVRTILDSGSQKSYISERVYAGLSSDIEKAFLQLSIIPEHQDYLGVFLPTVKETKIYRHFRVEFGICSSPFQLSACIDHLL
ncbi:putative RNA-directed DNA polymerase from transposon X-element [Trichonephila inaurata madagascariensis]|uniref:Putative RNA-directed DNA polymerase from transposon X-element n=1 Tax=Trichonephila inaurata madagascariensis TaxID=2747483 RepID=A0A8X6XSG5_9ARAC|nr:putative RNA-directed DNA polymerase from transposon X-element [Trichonephila inaurata madagascariensis]